MAIYYYSTIMEKASMTMDYRLENNEYSNPILKWNTALWGEIPADFGRK